MEVRNCRSCKRLFNVLSNERICPACQKKLEDKFQEVKQYLDEHKGASADEVSKEMEVSIKQIKEWVRQERLSFAEGSVDGVNCESCGKMIYTGRFCEACKARMANDLRSALDQPKKPEPALKSQRDGDRMRYL